MKRILFISLVIGLVLGFSAVSMAQLASGQFGVDLNILPHARIVVPPAGLDFGDIDFADGFARRTVDEKLLVYTNTGLHITVASRGFSGTEEVLKPLEGWEGWVSYYFWLPGRNPNSFAAHGWGGTWDPNPAAIPFTGAVTEIPFQASFEARESDWFQIEAGPYTDLITVTVTAKQ
jgi:hypothetical protein